MNHRPLPYQGSALTGLSYRPSDARVEATPPPKPVPPRQDEVSGVPVELTRIQFDLLDQLTSNPKQVLTRDQLMERVWGPDWFGDDHVVDVHIANLRKKLSAVTDRAIVRTVRGVGYGLAVS